MELGCLKTHQYSVRSDVVSSVRLFVKCSIVHLAWFEVRVVDQYIARDVVYAVNENPVQQAPESFRRQIRVTVTAKIQITIQGMPFDVAGVHDFRGPTIPLPEQIQRRGRGNQFNDRCRIEKPIRLKGNQRFVIVHTLNEQANAIRGEIRVFYCRCQFRWQLCLGSRGHRRK